MIVAVSLTMIEGEATRQIIHARLSILYDCVSIDEAIGIATVCACKEEPNSFIASVCGGEVKKPKKNSKEE